MPHPRTLCLAAASAIPLLLLPACAHQSIEMPAISGLYSAATVLHPKHVESSSGAPSWVHRDRVEDGYLYGVGIARRGRSPEESLYRAMLSARHSVFDELRERGAYVTAPGGLVPTLHYDDGHIEFERLGHDADRGVWYALARFELARHAEGAKARVEAIDASLVDALQVAGNSEASADEQVRAALSILYEFDRRQQHATQHRIFSGKELEPVDADALIALARSMLSEHGVRVEVEGPVLPGVAEAIESALGEVYLHTDEWGDARVKVRLAEREAHPGGLYLTLEGEIQMAIEGADARLRSRPLRVVQSGRDTDEARSRAAVQLSAEVGAIVRETLRAIADERSARFVAARPVEP